MKKLLSLKNAVILLAILVGAMGVMTGLLWHQQRVDKKMLQDQLHVVQASTFNNSYAAYTHVAVEPSENKVYIPELRLALPLTNSTSNLMYSLRQIPSNSLMFAEADITTQTEAAYIAPNMPVRSCGSVVRIKFETKSNPYNPEEKLATTVTLGNGQVLQVYSYHLGSCTQEWQFNGTNPDAIATSFKQANSY